MTDSIVDGDEADVPDMQRQFRAALSMFATGVAVITAPRQRRAADRHDGRVIQFGLARSAA